MFRRKKIEIYSAGCLVCQATVDLVRWIAGNNHDVEVLDTRRPEIAKAALRLGLLHVPAVLVDGEVVACCEGRGCNEDILRLYIPDQAVA